jgi:hypothetical protein
MDRERFDALTRLFAEPASRRAALGALLGAGFSGSLTAAAKPKRGKARRKGGRTGVTAQATCSSPGPSSNLNGCNFNNRDFAGIDLSSSAMRGTRFRGADLCGADLSSSQLKGADFRGFDAPGRATNLFRADLSSSGCRGTRFNARTLFCNTKTCNGSISNRDCPEGVDPADICCTDAQCGPNRTCDGGICVGGCPNGWTELPNGDCAFRCTLGDNAACQALGGGCTRCVSSASGVVCATTVVGGRCDDVCPAGQVCSALACWELCQPPGD